MIEAVVRACQVVQDAYGAGDPIEIARDHIRAAPELRPASRSELVAALTRDPIDWDREDAEEYLTGLEARLLAEALSASGEDRARYERVWALLFREWYDGRAWDDFGRWHPLGSTTAPTELAGAVRSALGSGYEILFPTVSLTDGYLLRATVSRVKSPPDSAPGPVWLAPWSHYLLARTDLRALNAALTAVTHPELAGQHFLLDMQPLRGDEFRSLAPPGFAIEGQSLGAAVLLAAWAAHRDQPALPSVVATGQVGGFEKSADAIVSVGGVLRKREAVDRYTRQVRRAVCFIVPRANETDARPSSDSVQVRPVSSVGELFDCHDLLTDGCDEYLSLLGAWPDPPVVESDRPGDYRARDLEELRAAADQMAGAAPGAALRFDLPFGNDPVAATRYVLGHLARRALASKGTRLVPFPISRSAVGAADSGVTACAVQDALRGLGVPGAEAGTRGAPPSEVLRNLLGSHADRVVLVWSDAIGPNGLEPAGVCHDRVRALLLAADTHDGRLLGRTAWAHAKTPS